MSVAPALGTYPYLFWNVLWLIGLLLVVRLLPLASHRRLILRLGLVMVPNGLFSLAYPDYWKDYWNPIRVGGWVLGPEDMLFAFNVGATACLAAILLYRHQLIVAEQPVSRIGRVLAVGIPAQCAFLVLFSMSRLGIASMILVQLMAVVPLLLLRPDLWRFSAAGGIGFSLIYCGIVRTVFWIWPDFVSCWNSTPPWGLLLFGIPLGEMAWALSFGLFWPLFAGFVFDLRLGSKVVQGAKTAGRARLRLFPHFKPVLRDAREQRLRFVAVQAEDPAHRVADALVPALEERQDRRARAAQSGSGQTATRFSDPDSYT